MKTKRTKFILALVIFSLTGQVAWVVENMYLNVFIYKMFNASEKDIALMVALSSVAATLTTLIIGALSDKIGKRKLFMVGGYILWGISILAFALIRMDAISAIVPVGASAAAVAITLVIILDCVMTFFGSSANDAAFNAWLTDSTDSTNRGAAEGINAMMPLVAMLAVFGGFMGFDLNLEGSWSIIFLIIGIAVLAIGVLGIFIIEEPKIETEENKSYFKNILYGFRPCVVKENVPLYLALAAFALLGIGIQIFLPYLIIYYHVSLAMENYVLIMAPAIVLASVFTFFYGKLYDKYRFRGTILPALVLLALGQLMLFLFKNTALVFIGSLLLMCGYLSATAIFGAVIRDHTPENKAGMFQGLRIVAQVLLPGVIGPAIGAAILSGADRIIGDDGTASLLPNANIFLGALIVAVVLGGLLMLWFQFLEKKNQEI